MFWVHATPATDLAVPYPDAPGRTELIDCTAAFRELPQDLKRRLEGLRAWHEDGHGIVDIENMGQLTEVEFYPGRTHEPGVLHELVRTHPHTGEKSLWCPLDTLRSVEGMSEEEALELLVPLKDHLLQPRFRYSHQHQPHDVMVWDTLQTHAQGQPHRHGDKRGDNPLPLSDQRQGRSERYITARGRPCVAGALHPQERGERASVAWRSRGHRV